MRQLAYYEAKLEALREIITADESVHFVTEVATGFFGIESASVSLRGDRQGLSR